MAQPLKFTRCLGSDAVSSSHTATAAAASKEPDRVDANIQVDVVSHRVSGRPHPQDVLIIVHLLFIGQVQRSRVLNLVTDATTNNGAIPVGGGPEAFAHTV